MSNTAKAKIYKMCTMALHGAQTLHFLGAQTLSATYAFLFDCKNM